MDGREEGEVSGKPAVTCLVSVFAATGVTPGEPLNGMQFVKKITEKIVINSKKRDRSFNENIKINTLYDGDLSIYIEILDCRPIITSLPQFICEIFLTGDFFVALYPNK